MKTRLMESFSCRCLRTTKNPEASAPGSIEVEPSTDPVHPVVTTTYDAHSLRDANRDRKDEDGGERLHRGKSTNRGQCNITHALRPVNWAEAIRNQGVNRTVTVSQRRQGVKESMCRHARSLRSQGVTVCVGDAIKAAHAPSQGCQHCQMAASWTR